MISPNGVPPCPLSDPGRRVRSPCRPFGESRCRPGPPTSIQARCSEWEKQCTWCGGGWWVFVGPARGIGVARGYTAADIGAGRRSARGRRASDPRPRTGGSTAFGQPPAGNRAELLAVGLSLRPSTKVILAVFTAGNLRAERRTCGRAAGSRNRAGIRDRRVGHERVAVTEWHGLVFVDRGRARPALFCSRTGALGSLRSTSAAEEMDGWWWGPGQAHYELRRPNWKILNEELPRVAYHCPSIKPALSKVSPPRGGGEENYSAPGIWVGAADETWRDGPHWATMSLTGRGSGSSLLQAGWTQTADGGTVTLRGSLPKPAAQPAPGLRD